MGQSVLAVTAVTSTRSLHTTLFQSYRTIVSSEDNLFDIRHTHTTIGALVISLIVDLIARDIWLRKASAQCLGVRYGADNGG